MYFQVSAETFETTTSGLVIWHTRHFPSGQLNDSSWQQLIGSVSLLTLCCSTLPLLCAHWPYSLEEVTKRWRWIHSNSLNPPIIWWHGCRVGILSCLRRLFWIAGITIWPTKWVKPADFFHLMRNSICFLCYPHKTKYRIIMLFCFFWPALSQTETSHW